MLYNAVATVRVRTVPALRDVIATMIACTYGMPRSSVNRVHRVQGLAPAGRTSRAMSRAIAQISEPTPSRSL